MKQLLSNALNVCSAIMMFKFGLPKLLGYEISVKTFTQFSQVLPVDAMLYMYFVGAIEVLIAIMMIATILIKSEPQKALVTYASYLMLVGTLLGALLHELFVRPAPVKTLLVYISVFLCVSAIQFALHFRSLPKQKQP